MTSHATRVSFERLPLRWMTNESPDPGFVYHRSLLPRLASGVRNTSVVLPTVTGTLTVNVVLSAGISATPLMPAKRLLGPLLAAGEAELALGLELFERHEDLGAFDAILAATTKLSGADALVSADRAFASLPAITHVDPGGPDLARLIDAGPTGAGDPADRRPG